MFNAFCFALLVLTTHNAFAQPAKEHETYTVSGYVSINDYEKFKDELSKKNIRAVRFENCLGGNGLAAFRFAEEIKKAKLTTVASGVVASACAFAFLGGSIRKIDEKSARNLLVFHGSFYPHNLKPKGREANQELLDIYEKHIGFRFGKTVQEIILNTTEVDEGVYFESSRTAAGVTSAGFYCHGRLPPTPSTCKNLDNITLESQGILKE